MNVESIKTQWDNFTKECETIKIVDAQKAFDLTLKIGELIDYIEQMNKTIHLSDLNLPLIKKEWKQYEEEVEKAEKIDGKKAIDMSILVGGLLHYIETI